MILGNLSHSLAKRSPSCGTNTKVFIADMTSIFTSLFENPNDTRKICTAIGLGAVGAVILPELNTLFAWIRLHFLYRSKLSRYHHSRPTSSLAKAEVQDQASSENGKPWALVTGASDGIGFGYVHQLASKSFNVILHGRNATKIASLIADLHSDFPGIQFEPFICEATDRFAWQPAFDNLLHTIKQRNLNLTVLVNNIGGNPENEKSFDTLSEYSTERLSALLDMNLTFPAQITRLVLPVLKTNKPALILNMSSVSGIFPLPYILGYGASKAFNRHFSKTLRMELIADGHGNDIEVLSIMSGTVQSGGMRVETSLFVPSSRAFAGSVLGMVGCGREEVTGWWSHDLQIWAMGTLLPRWARDGVLAKAMDGVRKQFEEEDREKAKKMD